MSKKKQMGFSLIELLIVVAIILIIAAIAVPNFLRARMAANESSAASSVRTIYTGEITYYNAYPQVGYAAQIQDLGGPEPCTASSTSACVIPDPLSTAIAGSSGKSGYIFSATGVTASGGSTNTQFVVGAAPVSVGVTGNKLFCATTDGTIRYSIGSGTTPVTTSSTCLAYNPI
jgi:type IV pilus assembly protein PilA